MPKLLRPGEQVIGGLRGISLQAAQAPGRAAAQIGNATISLGSAVAQQGLSQIDSAISLQKELKTYSQRALAAQQNAEFGDALNKGNLEFSKLTNQRLANRVDEKGNPNYKSLPDDVRRLGDQVKDSVLTTIEDPEVRQRFEQKFEEHITNKQISALGESRKQRIDHVRSSLTTSLSGLAEQAIQDGSVDINNHTDTAHEIIDTAVSAGAISSQEATAFKDNFRRTVRMESVRNMIAGDPIGTKEYLESNTNLGLKEQEKDRLIIETNAAISDKKRAEEKIQRQTEAVKQAQQTQRSSELDLGIVQGVVGEKEIEQEADNITPLQKIKLLNTLTTSKRTEQKKELLGLRISEAIRTEGPLYEFTHKQIGDHYKDHVDLMTDPQTKQAPTLSQKAALASKYTAIIKPYETELEFILQHGSEEQAIDALRAFEFTEQKSPINLSQMDTKSRAVATTALSLLRSTNLSDRDALRYARKQVLEKKDQTIVELKSKFKQEDLFSRSNIEGTVKDMLDADDLGFFHDDELSPGVQQKVTNLLETAYIETGNAKGAISLVKSQLKGVVGETEFNGGDYIMVAPPELMFPGIEADVLKQGLLDDISPYLPEGVTIEDVVISSDDATRVGGNITYAVGISNEHGQVIELKNQDGEIIRWNPTNEEMYSRQKQKLIDAAMKKREDKIKQPPSLIDFFSPDADAAPVFNLKSIAPRALNEYNESFKKNSFILDKYGITTPERKRAFFAQIGHESAGFTAKVERRSDASAESKYGYKTRVGRVLGNTEPGDGARYKGRGLIQLTGRDNYKRYGDMIGKDLVNNPELAADPQVAIEVAAAYWKSKGLNKLADRENMREITRRINGGFNGLSDRMRRYKELKGKF